MKKLLLKGKPKIKGFSNIGVKSLKAKFSLITLFFVLSTVIVLGGVLFYELTSSSTDTNKNLHTALIQNVDNTSKQQMEGIAGGVTLY